MDFEHAYDEHLHRVYGFFAYRVGNRSDAEDLTQLTFERAWRARDQFDRGRGSMATWLLAIARNLLTDHYRASHPELDSGIPVEELAPGALPRVDGPELRLGISSELAAALELLGAREREMLALRFGGDLSGPQIAALTGLSLGNVHQIISRSLRELRAALGPPA